MYIDLVLLIKVACVVWPCVRALPRVDQAEYLTRLKAKLFDEDLITLGSGESALERKKTE